MAETNDKGISKAQRIVDEVRQKWDQYESDQSAYIANIGEWADLFRVKPPSRSGNSYSNPRTTEFFRACNAIAGLMFRMQTSADPFFKVMPTNPSDNFRDLSDIEAVIRAQLQISEYKRYLLKANMFALPFGTVVCQEDYKTVGVGVFGRKIPVTTFRPRVMDQVAFDTSAFEIDDADWVATTDLVTDAALMRIKDEADKLGVAWIPKAVQAAIDLKENGSTIDERILMRLRRAGISGSEPWGRRKELIMYYGKLDTLNDGMEYVCGIINRKILVRFHANNFQHGMRPFRVAKWKDFDSPLGEGIGSLLAPMQRSLDANQQKIQDVLSMASYNMWTRKRGSVADEDLVIRPNQMVDVDDHNDLKPLDVNVNGAEAGLKLQEILRQEFRNSAGAPDILQAIVTTATTATQSSLAQNEAIRNVSISAEIAAEQLLRKHIEVVHANNVQHLRRPVDINKAGLARRIYPNDLRVDVDFQLKITTDKDYTPQRLTELQNLLATLISTKSAHPDQMNISILPIVKQIAHMLDVPPEDVIQSPMAPAALPPQDLAGLSAATIPPDGTEPTGGADVVQTPVGPTLASPQ